jgi:transcription elongation factor GreB
MKAGYLRRPKALKSERPDAGTATAPPNYISPAGLKRLSDERAQLWKVERPKIVETVTWAAANGDRSENGDYLYGKRRLREIDRRVRFLSKRIEAAQVVDNSGASHQRVFFGATVTYAEASGDERTVTIVGADEITISDDRISWRSPLATALLKARVDDEVIVRTPRGHRTLTVLDIQYNPVT